MKSYLLNITNSLFSADNGFAGDLLEHMRVNNFVTDHKFAVDFSSKLTFSRMEPSPTVAPPLFLIGRQAACRKIFGDEWADQIHMTQDIPVKKLPTVTANGYLFAREYGFHTDLIEFKSDTTRGAYTRLIIANKSIKNSAPMFFTTLQIVHEFERIH